MYFTLFNINGKNLPLSILPLGDTDITHHNKHMLFLTLSNIHLLTKLSLPNSSELFIDKSREREDYIDATSVGQMFAVSSSVAGIFCVSGDPTTARTSRWQTMFRSCRCLALNLAQRVAHQRKLWWNLYRFLRMWTLCTCGTTRSDLTKRFPAFQCIVYMYLY